MINFNLVKKYPDEPQIRDNGGISVKELKNLINLIEYAPEKINSIVFDWDRTFTCTEGFGINNNINILKYVNKEINFDIDDFKKKLDFFTIQKHYQLYKIFNHVNLKDKIKLGTGLIMGIDEDGNQILRASDYSEWKHNPVNSPKQLAQTYLLPYEQRNTGDYDVNNMDNIERIKLLKELFNKAYDKEKYIFILTNNKYSSKFLKEIMDTALGITFPIEHILRGGNASIWNDGMIKYKVMTRPYWPSVDVYKILKSKEDSERLMISQYQYTIDYLLRKAKEFKLKINDERIQERTKEKSYSNYLLNNITKIPDYKSDILTTININDADEFNNILNDIKMDVLNNKTREKKIEMFNQLAENIKKQEPKKMELGLEP